MNHYDRYTYSLKKAKQDLVIPIEEKRQAEQKNLLLQNGKQTYQRPKKANQLGTKALVIQIKQKHYNLFLPRIEQRKNAQTVIDYLIQQTLLDITETNVNF